MKRGYFVAGTDTEIGKTLIAGALVLKLRAEGLRTAGMKPVAAGTSAGPDGPINDDVAALMTVADGAYPRDLVNPYCFDEAIAPHLAAAHHGVAIDPQHILACYRALTGQADAVVVEGVGGWRVPLNDTLDAADLARLIGLPVVLVVGMRLGCISHALLTAESIRNKGLPLVGWVANRIDATMPFFDDNVAAISQRLQAPLLGVVPRLAHHDPAVAARFLTLPPVPPRQSC